MSLVGATLLEADVMMRNIVPQVLLLAGEETAPNVVPRGQIFTDFLQSGKAVTSIWYP